MPQVLTPPAAGMQEEATKNWYRAEALRKVMNDLANVYADVEDDAPRVALKAAIGNIETARNILSPPPKITQPRIRPRG